MSPDVWKCMNIHTGSRDELSSLVDGIVPIMRRLRDNSHLEAYFYNRYSGQDSHFLKFGYVNGDHRVDEQVERFLEENNLADNTETYNCEMWEVDGKPIDRIKCISCEISEIVKDNFHERITVQQAFYLLHFLMNQLGYSYSEEVTVYNSLVQNILRQME